jgi:hypothetical protein
MMISLLRRKISSIYQLIGFTFWLFVSKYRKVALIHYHGWKVIPMESFKLIFIIVLRQFPKKNLEF